MHTRHAAPLLQLRAEPEGRIRGYGSAFGVVDSFGEIVVPGAFAGSLRQHAAEGSRPLMLWAHRADAPIGRWERVSEDERGLVVEGLLNLRTEAGREAHAHLQAGDLNGLSVGFKPIKTTTRADGVIELRAADLVEVSVVTLPANPGARITSVRSQAEPPASLRELEAALRDLGYNRREAAAIAQRGLPALDGEADISAELSALHEALDRAAKSFQL